MIKRVIKYIIFLSIIFLSLLSSPTDSTPKYMSNYVAYWRSTSETATLSWDAPACVSNETENNCPSKYQIQLLWVQGDKILQVYDLGTVDASITTKVITAPRAGVFLVRIRAQNDAGDSIWANSSDPTYATVNGEPRAWMLIFYMAAPGPINVE